MKTWFEARNIFFFKKSRINTETTENSLQKLQIRKKITVSEKESILLICAVLAESFKYFLFRCLFLTNNYQQ